MSSDMIDESSNELRYLDASPENGSSTLLANDNMVSDDNVKMIVVSPDSKHSTDNYSDLNDSIISNEDSSVVVVVDEEQQQPLYDEEQHENDGKGHENDGKGSTKMVDPNGDVVNNNSIDTTSDLLAAAMDHDHDIVPISPPNSRKSFIKSRFMFRSSSSTAAIPATTTIATTTAANSNKTSSLRSSYTSPATTTTTSSATTDRRRTIDASIGMPPQNENNDNNNNNKEQLKSLKNLLSRSMEEAEEWKEQYQKSQEQIQSFMNEKKRLSCKTGDGVDQVGKVGEEREEAANAPLPTALDNSNSSATGLGSTITNTAGNLVGSVVSTTTSPFRKKRWGALGGGSGVLGNGANNFSGSNSNNIANKGSRNNIGTGGTSRTTTASSANSNTMQNEAINSIIYALSGSTLMPDGSPYPTAPPAPAAAVNLTTLSQSELINMVQTLQIQNSKLIERCITLQTTQMKNVVSVNEHIAIRDQLVQVTKEKSDMEIQYMNQLSSLADGKHCMEDEYRNRIRGKIDSIKFLRKHILGQDEKIATLEKQFIVLNEKIRSTESDDEDESGDDEEEEVGDEEKEQELADDKKGSEETINITKDTRNDLINGEDFSDNHEKAKASIDRAIRHHKDRLYASNERNSSATDATGGRTKLRITVLEQENESLRQKIKDVSNDNSTLQEQIVHLNERILHLSYVESSVVPKLKSQLAATRATNQSLEIDMQMMRDDKHIVEENYRNSLTRATTSRCEMQNGFLEQLVEMEKANKQIVEDWEVQSAEKDLEIGQLCVKIDALQEKVIRLESTSELDEISSSYTENYLSPGRKKQQVTDDISDNATKAELKKHIDVITSLKKTLRKCEKTNDELKGELRRVRSVVVEKEDATERIPGKVDGQESDVPMQDEVEVKDGQEEWC